MRHSEDLGISADAASWLFFYNGLASGICRLLVGRLGDVYSFLVPVFLKAGMIVAGISTMLLPLATSYTSLVLYMLVFGVADGCICISSNVLIIALLPVKNKAQGFGIFHFVISISIAFGPPLAGTHFIVSFARQTSNVYTK